MLHEPSPQSQEIDHAIKQKTRLGLRLFAVYCVVYAGFVLINTLSPAAMAVRTPLGVNLAVVYGFGLIVLAIVLGLAYNASCTALEKRLNLAKPETRS